MKKAKLKSCVEIINKAMQSKRGMEEVLNTFSSELITAATQNRSMRELARKTGFSVTLLSQAKNKVLSLSPKAFLLIANEIDQASGKNGE